MASIMKKWIFVFLVAVMAFPDHTRQFLGSVLQIPVHTLADMGRALASGTPLAGALITGLIAWIALRTNAAVNLRNKRADVILHCNSRYDQLKQAQQMIEGRAIRAEDPALITYFRRYWGLQSDQMDYWFAGYIDPETMTSWLMYLADTISKKGNTEFHKAYMSYLEELPDRNAIVNERLIETVEFIQVYACAVRDRTTRYMVILHYMRMLEREEGTLISRLSRDDHERFDMSQFSMTLRDIFFDTYISSAPRGFRRSVRKMTWTIDREVRKNLRAVLDWVTGESIEKYKTDLATRYPVIAERREEKADKAKQRKALKTSPNEPEPVPQKSKRRFPWIW